MLSRQPGKLLFQRKTQLLIAVYCRRAENSGQYSVVAGRKTRRHRLVYVGDLPQDGCSETGCRISFFV